MLDRDEQAARLARSLCGREDFPEPVAVALVAIATADLAGYASAAAAVLESFEARDDHLEDVPIADTVLVLQTLAAERGFAADLDSPLLPD